MNEPDGRPPPLPPGPAGRFTTDDPWRQRLRKDPHSDLPLLKAACLTSADGKKSHSIKHQSILPALKLNTKSPTSCMTSLSTYTQRWFQQMSFGTVVLKEMIY